MQDRPSELIEGVDNDNTRRRAAGWGWSNLLLAVATAVAGSILLLFSAQLVIGTQQLEADQRLVAPAFYLIGTGVYLVVILGVYLFAARRAGWAAVGVRRAGWLNFLLVPPLFVAELILLVMVNGAVGQLAGGNFDNPQVDALTGGVSLQISELLALLVLVAGLAPLAEELFFRGMLYPLLRARLGPAPAIVLNAAIFAVAHVIPLLMPGLFVVGLFLAYLRERSGSIWPSVLLHAMQNTLALLAINVALSGAV